MLSLTTASLVVLSSVLAPSTAIDLDTNSTASLRNASATIAYGLTSWYQNNQSSTPETAIGTLPAPLYWWEAGAVWGGLIDYWAYTGDSSYNPTVTQALQAQVGPDDNYMPPAYFTSLGNDDQAFWALAALAAVEYGFPSPPSGQPGWLELAQAVFDTQAARWDTSTCGGGLRWQIFQSNAGWTYKNTISNAAFFQIAARLARYTGNSTYADWADRSWDWMNATGLFDARFNVFDGSDDSIKCTEVDHTTWTYNSAVLIYGTAMMGNLTDGTGVWADRTTGLLTAIVRDFFRMKNATDIAFEPACEPDGTCDNDQFSFKAYLSRYLSKAAIVAPYILPEVLTLLSTSAVAAAQACSGGEDGTTCGQRWYVGEYDGSYGVGQELSALETVQAVLLLQGDGGRNSSMKRYPATGSGVQLARYTATSTFSLETATATPTGGSGRGGGGGGIGGGSGGSDGSGNGGGGSGGNDNSGASRPGLGLEGWAGLGLPVLAALFFRAGMLEVMR